MKTDSGITNKQRILIIDDQQGNITVLANLLKNRYTIMAAGSTDTRAVAKAHDAFRGLLETMHESRIRRLKYAGFSDDQAETLSNLHTPNFM